MQHQKIDQKLERLNLKAGEYVFFEGDLDSDFYIIEEGQVEIFTKNKAGKRVTLVLVEEGESFGEFALLDRRPRSASAQAKTDCCVVRISEEAYQQLLGELPIWASSMLKSFARRLINMNAKLKDSMQFIDPKK
jgi:CRP/FNR family cyclic AMP-dependent transcriptional regulator